MTEFGEVGECPMQTSGGLSVSHMGLFWRVVCSKAIKFSVCFDLRAPSLSVFVDPFGETSCVSSLIKKLLVASRWPQIVEGVIDPARVFVVYLGDVFASLPFPDDAVNKPNRFIDFYAFAPTIQSASLFACEPDVPDGERSLCRKMFSWSGQPCKASRRWIVIKPLAQIHLIWQFLRSHRVLHQGSWSGTPLRPARLAAFRVYTSSSRGGKGTMSCAY